MDENKFKCNECGKYYKSYQSLWNHKKRLHVSISPEYPQNIPKISPNIPNLSPEYPHNSTKDNSNSQPIIKITDKRNCDYCNKILSSYKNLHRHLQTCKLKDNEKEKNVMKNEIAELKKMVAELINNKSNTTNNTNNGNHSNNTTNTNNGTINNNNNYITIVPFTKENFVEVSTDEEHLLILTQEGYQVIYKCIKTKHYNDKYPQFHNFMIQNKRTNDALVYNEDIKDFKLENKESSVDDAITFAGFDIEEMLSLHENDINDEQKKNIERIINDTTPTPKYVEEHVSSMGYDYRNMVKNTYKKTRKNQQSLK
jgi:dsDNA-binding SOS-regulon protein